jgi:hypothetical protein
MLSNNNHDLSVLVGFFIFSRRYTLPTVHCMQYIDIKSILHCSKLA